MATQSPRVGLAERMRDQCRILGWHVGGLQHITTEGIQCRLWQSEDCTIIIHDASLSLTDRQAVALERLLEAEHVEC